MTKLNKTSTTLAATKIAAKRLIGATGADELLIHISDGRLWFDAKGPGGYARLTVPTDEVGDVGQASIKAAKINAIFAGDEPGDTKVTLTPFEGGLTLRFAGSRLRLLEPAASETTLFADATERNEAKVLLRQPYAEIKRALSAATRFSARKDIRVQLCGVHLSAENGKLKVRATDGYILHQLQTDIPVADGALEGNQAIVLPNEVADPLVGKVFPDDSEIELSLLGDSLIELKARDGSEFSWVSSLLENRYPNFDVLLDKENGMDDVAVVSKSDLVVAMNRVMAFAEQVRQAACLFSDGSLTIQSVDSEQIARINAQTEGVAIEFGLTPAMAIQAIEAVPTTKVMLRKKGGEVTSQIFVRPFDDDDQAAKGDWVAMFAAASI